MMFAIYTKEHIAIAKRLKMARFDVGMKQIDVAKRINRTQSYVSKIESGQRRFDIVQLREFAQLYNKPIEYFIK